MVLFRGREERRMTRRLIDANAYLAKMRPKGISDELWEECGTYKSVINEPTVDAEPVRHGEWIDEGYYADYTNVSAWRCSECCWHMIGYSDELFRYCPSCGAKMEKK